MNFTNCTTEFSSGKFGFIFLWESKIAAEPLASGCLQGQLCMYSNGGVWGPLFHKGLDLEVHA